MSKTWSLHTATVAALAKLPTQRSPTIDRAIWASKADPTKIIRAMEARLTQALATAEATAPPKTKVSDGGSGSDQRVNPSLLVHQKATAGSKLVNGGEYVRVSVSYPKKTEEAVEYLAGLFKLSYEETVRLSLEAYIKHL